MATWTWKGGRGHWYDPSFWSGPGGTAGHPLPGDVAVVGSGEADLVGPEAQDSGKYDDQQVTLGSSTAPATLSLDDAIVGRFFSLTAAGNATVAALGRSDYSGSIAASVAGTTLTLESGADAGGTPGDLVLARGGSITVSDGAALDLEGAIALERGVTLAPGDAFIDNARVSLLSGLLDVQSTSFTGTGGIAIGTATTAEFEGAVPSTQTIAFAAKGGKLQIADPTTFKAAITGFAPGSLIDLTKTKGDAASYDAGTGTLTVTQAGATVATLTGVSAQAGPLSAVSDGANGTYVEYAGTSGTRLPYEISQAATAERADVAQTLTVPGTANPITGAGVRIGILSDSFDVVSPGSADTDAENGYLPAKPDGTSAVKVLKEGPSGSEDEGRAMAELVHQIAPGASIDFYTAADGIDDFAAGVGKLQQDGCQVILDDYSFRGQEPFYQVAGPADTAISAAIGAGVSYFTLATNYGDAYYEHAFDSTPTTLYDGSQVAAMTFSNGTPYQSITLSANTKVRIDLQWDAPLYGADGTKADQVDSVQFKVFDSAGKLVGSSIQRVLDGQGLAESELSITTGASAANDQIAIYDADGAPVSQIKYVLFGSPSNAESPGGTIDDPDAGTGSGLINGHALVPGAITVGATFAGNTPAYGQPADFLDYFSSGGPGELLFDGQGHRLAQPEALNKVDLTGVDGIYTSVPGFQAFYGTSAATPDAGAVAALMLQADPRLTTAQVAALVERTALPFGTPSRTGAGLIQADGAVRAALTAATTPIWTAQAGSTRWSDAANWSDGAVPGSADTAVIADGDGQLAGAFAVTYDLASSTIAGLTMDGTTTTRPSLTIAAGDSLAVSGAATLADGTSLTVLGGFAAARLSVDASSGVGFAQAGDASFAGAISGAGSVAKSGAGRLTLTNGANSYAGGTRVAAGVLELGAAGAAGSGAIAFAAAAGQTATLLLDGAAQAVGGVFGDVLADFGPGGALDLAGFSFDAADAAIAYMGGQFTVQDASGETETFDVGGASPRSGTYYAHDDGAGGTRVDSVVCFCTGTRILTARGEVAVEDLRVGDMAVTASGARRPVRWIGRQTIDCAAHPRPQDVMPVRVQAGALGEGRPSRDLWVSPGHALCLDMMGEVLVPASALVNGATVAQVDVERVTYWHIELDSHDVLIADGVPAESYIDTGNRAFFGTGEGALDPERAPASLADYCRPFHGAGPLVSAARARLRARAVSLGWRLAGERLGDMHLVCDGARVEADADGLLARFAVPAAARDVWLCSDASVPLHGSDDAHADPRPLGLCVAGLGIDDGLTGRRAVAPDDGRLIEGWHAPEPGHRWTAGRARLAPALWAGCRGLFFLRVELAQVCLPGWRAPEGSALCAAPGIPPGYGGAPAGRALRLAASASA